MLSSWRGVIFTCSVALSRDFTLICRFFIWFLLLAAQRTRPARTGRVRWALFWLLVSNFYIYFREAFPASGRGGASCFAYPLNITHPHNKVNLKVTFLEI
jgi:hypothetical protein